MEIWTPPVVNPLLQEEGNPNTNTRECFFRRSALLGKEIMVQIGTAISEKVASKRQIQWLNKFLPNYRQIGAAVSAPYFLNSCPGLKIQTRLSLYMFTLRNSECFRILRAQNAAHARAKKPQTH